MTTRLTYRQRRNRTIIGTVFFSGGAATVAWVLGTSWHRLVSLDWLSLTLFAVVYILLGLRAVEVNDRLNFSSSVMPMFTAGVVFAIQSGSGTLAMMLLGASGLFGPGDIRQRRVFQPASNFGQLTISAVAVGLVFDWALVKFSAAPITGTAMLPVAMVGAMAALVNGIVNVGLVRLAVRVVYGVDNLAPWSGMLSLFSAQLVMGVVGSMLGVLLLASSGDARETSVASPLIPLVLGVYVIANLVYSSYSKLRTAHEDSLRGFVKTLETRDLYTRGHTERVAMFCYLIGEELGFTGTQQERMRWAALIHDMGKLAVPAEVLSKHGSLSDDEYRELRRRSHRVDDLLSQVDFLRPMVEIASGCHPRLATEDFDQRHHRHTPNPTLDQKVLAVADAFDAMTSSRTYRMSVSQTAAFEGLGVDDSPLYDPDVVAALNRGVEKTGNIYGQPTLGQWHTPELAEVENG